MSRDSDADSAREGLPLLRRRRGTVFCALVAVAFVCVVWAAGVGAFRVPPADVLAILWTKISFSGAEGGGMEADVLWQLRFPRVLLGFLVGATLAVSGAIMQGLFRNPLADPGLIGVASGAALGAVFTLVLAGVLLPGVAVLSDQRFLPLTAFAGAAWVTFFIYRMATVAGQTAVTTLLLAGVAVNALAGAVIGLATFLATDAQLRGLAFWTLGSLGGAGWGVLAAALPGCALVLLVAPKLAPVLNAMALGEAETGHLGFALQAWKRVMVLVTAAGVGTCVALTGMIGFIGLVVPHIIRITLGPDHRWLLPSAAVLGGTVLVAGDACARTWVAPAELPIGVLTALVGAPCFLGMLFHRRRRMAGLA